ncbi:ABC transporter substrate-binding protein [Enterobacter sp. Bisph1]|uniref:heme/hemin ABC transporter substrate-binding protein n=1 Tax=Enterobacter sp. Bisph1 TaxID=1274399 RepID=UPI00057C2A1B|nr:ABC transporter substrate-binding protein [Enterobacter sp. Bisph1]
MKTLLLVLMALSFSLSAAAQKIVSLGGDVTEIIYGLNAQSALVGRDSTSIWPVQAQQLPDVGYLRQLNAEGILSLRPTLVLASAYAQPSRVLQTVQENHVKVVTLPGDYTLAAIDKKIAVVADAIGKPDAGAALRQRLAAQIAALAQQPLNKRALFILSHSGMGTLVAGQQTAADSALRAAGLQNAMQGFDHYRALSQEGVMASQADLIVISADSVKAMGGEENLWHQPGLAQTPAGRKKQLLMVDDIALLGFSVRTPQALLALRQQAEQLP